ncbi:MAG: hypothetical protein ACFFKA_08665 [Candidatus Thorarchaeota archaeon]
MSYKLSNSDSKRMYGFSLDKISANEEIFYAIYFIDNLTGSLLLCNKYNANIKLFSNEDLICGFLNALNLFINELKLESKEDFIQEINFKETRILYEQKGRLSVIAISKKTSLEVERMILHEIMEDFYQNFESSINNFNGILDPSFLNYKKRLENINLNSFYKLNKY